MVRLSLVAGSAVVCTALGGSTAHAWQIESFVTNRCHERITENAVAAIGYPDGLTSPAASDEERRIIADVPFSFGSDQFRTSWGVALLVGVRNNDLEDNEPTDLAQLGSLHNDPHKQDAHCLRESGDDGLAGDQIALDRCKAFVLNELTLAFGSADGATIDFESRVDVPTFLKFRQKTTLHLNAMAFHLGRAMHGLEDSYTHILRDSDTDHVRSVLNWIEGNLSGVSYDEARDGYPHIGTVDDCTIKDEATRNRERRSTSAAKSLLAAIASSDGGNAGRLARAAQMIDSSFILDPGCTMANDYCNAPEIQLADCGCGTTNTGMLPGLAVLGFLFLRRRRASAPRGHAALAAAATLALLLALPRSAHADTPAPAPTGTEPAADGTPVPVAPVLIPVDTGEHKTDEARKAMNDQSDAVIAALPDPTTKKFGFAASLGGSVQRGGAAAAVGLRWNPCSCVGLGLDVEYNPYVSFAELDVSAGSLQVYVPVIWKFKRFGNWELRSTFGVGASMLMFDLVQADKYSIGAFANWNPLGVAYSFGPKTKLVVKPGDIAVPIPELTGFPFYYPQYRFTVGFEWYP